ncbi:dipeptide ABC transporter ATP-binding protein [Roseococcus pinisoli]|uniref:ABC transporter ATP-binding protein n=1 Tax=Roseococcus pinisoli TaxID=2835040 RepID=A0ABS5QBG6_9PROT|nr:ABC transporter ATP-binding protein [Roseococcus pinisoli]MBS7810305.1 ABC transporter ATP-binding protein [Roseococcus pinisoli]
MHIDRLAVSRAATEILRVEDLSVAYGRQTVVRQAGFTLEKGKALALIGESGSGKSTIAKAVLGLLGRGEAKVTGRIRFKGEDLLALPERKFRALRGRAIGFVPQDPQNALNPVRTIGSQAHEAARLLDLPDGEAERRAILDTFALIGLADPERVYRSYPHQMSGGMLQRVLIGLAVLPRPDLIVADEPTSALDVTIQKRILDLLMELRGALDLSLLFITHDLALAAERTDEVVVLKDGAVQEIGASGQVFRAPASDYARRLQADVPALNPDRFRAVARRGQEARGGGGMGIRVEAVSKSFHADGRSLRAVDEVSFSVAAGRTHALVGESGSGKTTLVRLLLGLETPDAGRLTVDGQAVHGLSRDALRGLRRNLQLVYQNPFTSLDPTWKVRNLIREPLDQYRLGDRAEREARVLDTLRSVGLSEELLERRPAKLSGGQRQRVAIARALVLRPRVLVLDEPTSALDVTVQAGILQVLSELQAAHGLTYLFISHDLSVVRQIADTVTVLRHGRVVEQGAVEQVFERPAQAYTRALIDSIPRPRRAESAPAPARDHSYQS